MLKPKIAFVVQRSGREVAGGAESYCLTIARQMSDYWDIEILTTTALDYMSWENYYVEGIEMIGSVTIRRFRVDKPRDEEKFNAYSQKILDDDYNPTLAEAKKWMQLQGPLSSGLEHYIHNHSKQYDSFFFFTYLYATSYYMLPLVAEKSILVPFAHEEKPLYLPIWDEWFSKAANIIFSSVEERDLIGKRFPNIATNADTIGIGVDRLDDISPLRIRQKYNIYAPYILYVGRIDESKGCDHLFQYFMRFKEEEQISLKLLLIGKQVMQIPKHHDIIHLGFVDNQSKFDAICACEFLVNPSPFESLSMVLLEAWSLDKPTLVNAQADVMVGQSRRSGGGESYYDYHSFRTQSLHLLKRGYRYRGMSRFVKERYSWSIIKKKFLTAQNKGK